MMDFLWDSVRRNHATALRVIHLISASLSLQGPIMNCTRLAEKAVALVCCEKLHKIGKTRMDILQICDLKNIHSLETFSLHLF